MNIDDGRILRLSENKILRSELCPDETNNFQAYLSH